MQFGDYRYIRYVPSEIIKDNISYCEWKCKMYIKFKTTFSIEYANLLAGKQSKNIETRNSTDFRFMMWWRLRSNSVIKFPSSLKASFNQSSELGKGDWYGPVHCPLQTFSFRWKAVKVTLTCKVNLMDCKYRRLFRY